jgi:hypothetical protein
MKKRNLPEMDVMRSAHLLLAAVTPGGDRVLHPAQRIPAPGRESRR